MTLEEQKEAIIQYGNNRYNEGYRDAILTGITVGGLLTIISLLSVTIIKRY